MERLAELQALIALDHPRMRVLRFVRELDLPDCWVAAGFVRNLVWDHAHQRSKSPLPTDIDVIWHDPEKAGSERDAALESALRAKDNVLNWSVKNQARMYHRNADKSLDVSEKLPSPRNFGGTSNLIHGLAYVRRFPGYVVYVTITGEGSALVSLPVYFSDASRRGLGEIVLGQSDSVRQLPW